MPRKPVPILSNEPYHISARCLNKQWFDLRLETVWSIMEDYLFLINAGYGIKIHSFVLMSNHFHLLITAPNEKLSAAMLYFMRETSKEITRLSGRINQTYGGRNHKTWIGNYHHFLNSYKYVYQNPIRANICSTVKDYRFSTLHGLLGRSKLIIPIDDNLVLNPSLDLKQLNWLDEKVSSEAAEHMRLALRKPKFELPICPKTTRKNRLETDLL